MAQTHIHHYFIFAGLSISSIVMIVSCIWLVKALRVYANNHDAKVSEKRANRATVRRQGKQIKDLTKRLEALENDKQKV